MNDDIEYNDLLGNPIVEGSPVGYADGNTIKVGTVEKMTPKMVKIRKLRTGDKRYRSSETLLRYPYDIVVLDQKLVTMYLLKL